MDYSLVTKPAFKLIGYELRTASTDGRNHREIPAFWSQYLQENRRDLIPNRVHVESLVELGVCADFNMETREFSYIIGMEVTHFEGVTEGLVCREFPEAKYAVFNTPKVTPDQFSSSIQSTWREIFEKWFPHAKYEHAGSSEFELYDERCHEDKNELVQMSIYIPIKERQSNVQV